MRDPPNPANGTTPNGTTGLEPAAKQVVEKLRASARPEDPQAAATVQARDRQQGIARLAGVLGQRYAPDRVKLSRFEVYHPAQATVIAHVRDLAERLEPKIRAGEGLIFLGGVGTGKDHLLAALLYAAISRHGFNCSWVNGQEVFGRFRDNIDTGQRDEEFFRALGTPDVLAISDPIPPVGNLGAWDIGNLYRILDRRYRCLKPTWVSVNALNEEDADNRLSAPVFDRLREGAEIIRCFWPSFRERKRA